MATAELESILARRRRDPLQLLQILIEAQAHAGWLPPATLSAVAASSAMRQATPAGSGRTRSSSVEGCACR